MLAQQQQPQHEAESLLGPTLAGLNARSHSELSRRQTVALDALAQLGAGQLSQALSPSLARLVLDSARLGGLDGSSVGAHLSAQSRSRLMDTRSMLVELSKGRDDARVVGCVVPPESGQPGAEWIPINVKRLPRSAASAALPAAVVFDDGLQRLDRIGRAVRDHLAPAASESGSFFVVRTRLPEDIEELSPTWLYGLDLAVNVSMSTRASVLPRWAAVAPGADPDLEGLPWDVRILVSAGEHVGGLWDSWEVFGAEQHAEATAHYSQKSGGVRLAAECTAEAALFLTRFESVV